MLKSYPFLLCSLILFSGCNNNTDSDFNSDTKSQHQDTINWQPFEAGVFDRAKDANKLVFLEIGANWCHWCHVMDEKTYSDPEVQDYLEQNFILTREDQDSRPDLYATYRRWGWPAIIVFNAKAEELLRLKGYQEKGEFLTELKSVVENPEPLPEDQINDQDLTYNANAAAILQSFKQRIDHEKGAYPWNHKLLDLEGVLLALNHYRDNDSLKKWLDITIENSYNLVDPVWSGVYQYSAKESWDHQHYEKLLKIQARYIEAYSRYGVLTGNKKAILTAEEIVGYCDRFLGNETPLYYNSQNADLIEGKHSESYYKLNEKKRLEKGVPSVDQRIYLKENAALAKSLLYLWAATDKQLYLDRAAKMVDYILDNFEFEGLYCREKGQTDIISFEDNRQLLELLMLFAQLDESDLFLQESEELAKVMYEKFFTPSGMISAIGDIAIKPAVVPKDNLKAVLTYNYLGQITEKDQYKEIALSIYEKLNKKALQKSVANLPLLYDAVRQLDEEAYHAVLIVEKGTSTKSRAFFKVILNDPSDYIVFEQAEIGNMSSEQEIMYSGVSSGTLFMCTSSFCSSPIKTPKELLLFLNTSN